MAVSCFFMAVGLDEGEVLLQKEYVPMKNIDIDAVFDPWMRADTLCHTILSYLVRRKEGQKERGKGEKEKRRIKEDQGGSFVDF